MELVFMAVIMIGLIFGFAFATNGFAKFFNNFIADLMEAINSAFRSRKKK